MRVLVAEDDDRIAETLVTALTRAGFAVERESEGDTIWFRGDTETFDAVILDLGLPQVDGLTILKRWRNAARTMPVLILTARGQWEERVDGIEAGADDYVVKPFQFEELEARLNALVRRAAGFVQAQIQAGPLVLDLHRRQATVDEEAVPLTGFEYRILEYLMRHHQQVVSKDRLMEQLYPDDEERDPNVIEVLVGRLRRKLEAAGDLHLIETVRGQGYLFSEPCR